MISSTVRILILVALVAAAPHAAAAQPTADAPDLESLAAALRLTPAQRAQVRDLIDAGRKEQIPLRAEMEVIELDLRRELEKPNPDETRVGTWAVKLGGLEGAVRKSRMLTWLRLRKTLTAAQRRQLETLHAGGEDLSPGRRAPKGLDCDEVACVIEPDRACCKKLVGQASGPLPDRLDRAAISSGISRVKPAIASCAEGHHGSGHTIVARIAIGASGTVTSVSPTGGTAALRACLTSTLKKARFAPARQPITVSYPFVF
jgi:Spy/CpxP family protein refolding chaperone